MAKRRENLIWIDCEMTGLDPKENRIIEIATVVTDAYLNILATGPVLAIHQHQKLLDSMDEWNKTHHAKSGLIERVKESTINESQAEALTIDFLKLYVTAGHSPICGSSVWQDRRFLDRYMPHLEAYFHYRNIDVSSIKELAKRWFPEISKQFQKRSKHTAADDVLSSIEELRFYRDKLFKLEPSSSSDVCCHSHESCHPRESGNLPSTEGVASEA